MKNLIKNKKIIIIIAIIILIPITYLIVNNILKKESNENVTTKLKSDSDYLNWFIDFDNLYEKKVKTPKYSLTKESFEKIYNLLNNNEENNIYYKDNIYYFNNNTTIELDVNTRSLRYTKYENDKAIEILEIRLLNGKYFVQLVNQKYLYKITFNKDKVTNKKYKNKGNEIIIKDTIFNNENFNWY